MRDIRKLGNRTINVSPSLLAADFGCLASEIDSIERAGAKMLHLDVMDGVLVPNISFGVPVIKSLRSRTELLFDTHLMIAHPLHFAAAFAEAGADHLTFHWECGDDISETIREIRRVGCTVGISVKPATPVSELAPYLDLIDLVLVMTVEPGFGGQSFMSEELNKVSELRSEVEKRRLGLHIEIDGGVARDTAQAAARSGANLLVAGTSVFRHPAGAARGLAELLEAQKELEKVLSAPF